MARNKRHEEHIDETWLIPYSDLLTLLLALFIVLFAISNVDASKYQAIKEAFNAEFGSGSTRDDGDIILPGDKEYSIESMDQQIEKDFADPEMQGLFDSLEAYVASNGLKEHMELSMSDDGVLITLSSDVWFASGIADLSQTMHEYAVSIAELLAENQKDKKPLNIIITGHTDNRPINTASFRSNWHLSVARAVNFMEIILENPSFDPRHFSARGYGEYEPIADNGTDEGRQSNRRVEVLVTLADSK